MTNLRTLAVFFAIFMVIGVVLGFLFYAPNHPSTVAVSQAPVEVLEFMVGMGPLLWIVAVILLVILEAK